MPKVILNKTTKIKGKGLILAGVEVDVTESEKSQLTKDGFIGAIKKPLNPTNEKEIQSLISENEKLKSQKTTKAE